jgi:hypothetical protein
MLFRFAAEEVVYLLRSLRLSDFPGFAPQSLKQLAAGEKSLSMMDADHTLRARGLVRWRSETERELDPLIGNLLLECWQPGYPLFVHTREASNPDGQLLYLFGEEITVEQCELEPQVQQYLVIRSREDFARRLWTLAIPQLQGASRTLPGVNLSQRSGNRPLRSLARTR